MIEPNYQQFCLISSPAKIILCGQHAVVYGKDAIAIGITLHCKALLKKRKRIHKAGIIINSQIQTSPLVFESQILQMLQQRHKMKQKYTFQQFLKELPLFQMPNKSIRSNILNSIHFKLSLLLKQQEIDWKKWEETSQYEYLVYVSSQIPIGKCLGSSAAFNTVLTTALLIIFEVLQAKSQLSQKEKQKINSISIQMESVEHGNPSGIDNYISVNGGVILYNKNKQPRFKDLTQSLGFFKNYLNIGIIDSGIDKNTKLAVSKVRQNYDSSEIYKQKIDQIGQLTSQIRQIIQEKEYDILSIDKLLKLTSKNHCLLRDLGVSHPKIQELVEKWQNLSWSVKITGSGMGGCVLLLSHKQNNKHHQELTLVQIDQQGIQIIVYNK